MAHSVLHRRATLMASVARILLVEPDDLTRAKIEAAALFAHVESHRDFQTARERLLSAPFDLLVTNLRLEAYNGLHLVYLSRADPAGPRAIVYSHERDPWLAREVHQAGAFYEIASCLPVTLAAYLSGSLPVSDRRDPVLADRRRMPRGGHRSWDHHVTQGKPLVNAPTYRM